MFEILPVNDENILAFKASGKLTDDDYQQFIPILEDLIRKSGCLLLYIELENFQGWDAKAAWDDLHFGLQHDHDFTRIAIVGNTSWEHAGIALANFFTHSNMQFFTEEESDKAWEWLKAVPEKEQVPESMPAYKSILLPTDFSEHSLRAAQRARALSAQYGAHLYVMHIVEDTIIFNQAYDPVIADVRLHDEKLMQQANDSMSKFVEFSGLGKDATLEVQWGNPKRSIISWAREKKVDLIVMGSHGRHGIGRLLGSISTSVMHQAPCDVLIVK